MKKLAIILAVALLASCSQPKEGTKQTEPPKSSQQKAETPKTTKPAATSSYSVFNKATLDEFTEIFQAKYVKMYNTMSLGGKIPQTPIEAPQANEMIYDYYLSPYLVLSCVLNDDGTISMANLMKMEPASDENYDADIVAQQFAILKQALIAATAPGATTEDIKAINDDLPTELKPNSEDISFVYKGIAYMANLDTEDPEVSRETLITTYE